MSDASKMDLDFTGLPRRETPAAEKAAVRKVASDAGTAEGFTSRTAVKPGVSLKRGNVQLNLKVPPEFRNELFEAFAEASAEDRSIRSPGEFLVRIFNEWKAGKG